MRDRLAGPARHFLAHRLDDLPAPRDHLQGLGDVLAELRQSGRSAAGTGLRRGDDDALARQMVGEGLARRPPALEGVDRWRLRSCSMGCLFVFARRCLEVFKLQLHLLQKPRLAFRAAAVELSTQLLDRQLQVCDERFRARQIGLGVGGLGTSLREFGLRLDARRALGEDHRMSTGKVGGERFGGSGHRARESYPPPSASRNLTRPRLGARLPGDDASRCRTEGIRAAPERSSRRRRRGSATGIDPAPASW